MNGRIARMGSAVVVALAMAAPACGGDDDPGGGATPGDQATASVDVEAAGLWDDGPCDEALEPLRLGLMTVFQSPVVSLEDQALALEAAAVAFNERGGANGACIEVHTCDDGANADQAVACVREIDQAGVVATVNDQGTGGPAEVAAAMAEAGIPRVATNVNNTDWGDPNAYPLDASGTGYVFLSPHSLIEEGATSIGIVRVDLPEAAALAGLLESLYADDGAEIGFDAAVPAGTTDYAQFVLGAQDAGVDAISLAVGEQEAIQVIRAGEQLGSDLLIGAGMGNLSHAAVSDLGDIAEQMVVINAYPPATLDLPVYEVLRSDLAASGVEELQPENLKGSPMRSWIGLYALLVMIREAGLEEFDRDGITSMLREASDVPMLDMFGGESWTPDLDHPGAFARAGMNHWATYRWDPEAPAPGDLEGNFVETTEFSFDEVMCGSPFGAPGPCSG